MTELASNLLKQSIAALNVVLASADLPDAVMRAAEVTASAMKGGHKLMVAGNGGSAAEAQHMVAEFVSRLTVDRPAMPAIALTTDTSILTAIGNDYSYDKVFERQIEALGQPGDVFLGLSTSGNSKNVVRAAALCRQRGITTLGFLGGDGGAMLPLCDIVVQVPSSSTMNIQEAHLVLIHVLCLVVERLYFGSALSSATVTHTQAR